MVDSIKNGIKSGTWMAGQLLPAETELAEKYRLSKNSIRKGLDQLAAEGYIEKLPRVGNRIAAAAQAEKTAVKFVCNPSLIKEANMERLINLFHERYPHIRVQMIPLSEDDYVETIRNYMKEDLADLITVNYGQYQMIMEYGGFEQLERLEDDPKIYPFLQNRFKKEGYMYAKPFIFSPVVLCYNRKHFLDHEMEEPDSSWTWDMLLETAKKLVQKQNRYGFYFHLLSQNRWSVFLLQNGFTFDRNNGSFDPERFIEGMKLCRKMIFQQGILPLFLSEKDQDAETLLNKENVSIIMTTYFSLNHLTGSDIPFEIAPLPYIHEPRTLLLTIGIGLLKHSKHKEEAKLFLDFLLSYEGQLLIRKQTLSIPSHKLAAEWIGQEEIYRPNRFHMYREIINSFRDYSELGMTDDEIARLRSELPFFWSGMMNEEQLLSQLEHILQG